MSELGNKNPYSSGMKRQSSKLSAGNNDLMMTLDMSRVRVLAEVYEKMFEEHPTTVGKAISKKEREETAQQQTTLVYGEITFESFGLVLERIKKIYGMPNRGNNTENGILQHSGGVFYDLGSGTGKPVIAAGLLHDFDRVVGVEILEGLYVTSLEVHKKWLEQHERAGERERVPTVEFLHGDMLDFGACDWRDGDIVFANSTCFDSALMNRLADKAAELKRGAIVITLTRKLPGAHFDLLEAEMRKMSWGSATVYVQQKASDPVSKINEDRKEDGELT